MLRTVAEDTENLPPHVVTAIAVNPPIDLYRSVQTLDSLLGRLYNRYFTRRLVKHIQLLNEHQPEARFIDLPKIPRTIYELDDVVTAPLSGFDSADHYYESASSKRILQQITRPSLILTAEDDPLVPVEMFDGLAFHPAIKLHVAPHGGHMGYRGRRGDDPDHHWMDWRILEWLDQHGRYNSAESTQISASA